MKRTVWLWQLSGFAFTSFFGTLLHFLYEWLDESIFAAPFSGVNESTFEHMKLLFWPMFILAIFESFFFKSYGNFWCIKLKGILLGLILIPIMFYTYNGVIGKSPDFVNISIFFITAAIVYIYEMKRLNSKGAECNFPTIALALILIIAFIFVIFTFIPPKIGLFKDPVTGLFGTPS